MFIDKIVNLFYLFLGTLEANDQRAKQFKERARVYGINVIPTISTAAALDGAKNYVQKFVSKCFERHVCIFYAFLHVIEYFNVYIWLIPRVFLISVSVKSMVSELGLRLDPLSVYVLH